MAKNIKKNDEYKKIYQKNQKRIFAQYDFSFWIAILAAISGLIFFFLKFPNIKDASLVKYLPEAISAITSGIFLKIWHIQKKKINENVKMSRDDANIEALLDLLDKTTDKEERGKNKRNHISFNEIRIKPSYMVVIQHIADNSFFGIVT